MNQSTVSDRDWRLDLAGEACPEVEMEPVSAMGSIALSSSGTGRFSRWKELAMHWARDRARQIIGPAGLTREEAIVHELARIVGGAEDPEVIERSLIGALNRITRARSVQWLPEPHRDTVVAGEGDRPAGGPGTEHPFRAGIPAGSDRPDRRGIELVLRAGRRIMGRIRVLDHADGSLARSPAMAPRLETLCTMAAGALERLDRQANRDPQFRPSGPEATAAEGVVLPNPSGLGPELTREGRHCLPTLQDATFLNAVLPFAVGQARRYGEPLSLLCVAIDRLGGIRELLGRERADQVVRGVGLHIAGMIRSSDIVARIDDDRIIAVLPRVQAQDALSVAGRICWVVEKGSRILPELPLLTVSIGVADFPSSADTVFALLDAADHALTVAQTRGRNRAVAADPLAVAATEPLAQFAS
jgi:diguanylate cyclase (GGDEF)-like protein